MNPICQDRTIAVRMAHLSRFDSHQPAGVCTRSVLAPASMNHVWYAPVSVCTYQQVGKTFANLSPFFANLMKLADPCQLHVHTNQALTLKLASWQVGNSKNAANLPTGRKPAWMLDSQNCNVGENSPLPTGEVDNPDLSRCVHLWLKSWLLQSSVVRDVDTPHNLVKGGRHHG